MPGFYVEDQEWRRIHTVDTSLSPYRFIMKTLCSCVLSLASVVLVLTAEAQEVPSSGECTSLTRQSPMHATYCKSCARSGGKDRASCENYWNYLDPSRIKNAAKRREKENAAAAKAGLLWSSIPADGTCSFVAQGMRGYRSMSAELNLNQLERNFYSSPLSLSASQTWTHNGGTVSGNALLAAQVLPSEELFVYLRNRSVSAKFKYFARPSQMTLFANGARKLIRHPARIGMGTPEGFPTITTLTHLNMQGGQRPSEKEDVQRVVASAECDVSYLLTKFQFCGHIQRPFERHVSQSFCGGGLKDSEVNRHVGFSHEDAFDAERFLQTLNLDVGEVATMLGKGPLAPNGTQLYDGGVWRILRVR